MCSYTREIKLASDDCHHDHCIGSDELTKCSNLECNNLISDVNQKTRQKIYCSELCRNKVNNLKKRGVHNPQAQQLICIDCKMPNITNAETRCNQRRICKDCTVIRTRRRSREAYWRRKNV